MKAELDKDPRTPEQKRNDDELREAIETQQLQLLKGDEFKESRERARKKKYLAKLQKNLEQTLTLQEALSPSAAPLGKKSEQTKSGPFYFFKSVTETIAVATL